MRNYFQFFWEVGYLMTNYFDIFVEYMVFDDKLL